MFSPPPSPPPPVVVDLWFPVVFLVVVHLLRKRGCSDTDWHPQIYYPRAMTKAGVWNESEARLHGDDNSGVLPSSANPPAGASLWREGGDLETGGTTQNITSTTTATNVGNKGTPASPKTSGSRTAGMTNTQQGKTSALLRVVKLQRIRSGDGSELDTAYDTAL